MSAHYFEVLWNDYDDDGMTDYFAPVSDPPGGGGNLTMCQCDPI